MTIELETLTSSIKELCGVCRNDATANGWWEKPRSELELVALMHTELSEVVECVRDNEPDLYFDDAGKPLGRMSEYADVLIRIFDAVGPQGDELAEAVHKKILFNRTRGYRHGGKVA